MCDKKSQFDESLYEKIEMSGGNIDPISTLVSWWFNINGAVRMLTSIQMLNMLSIIVVLTGENKLSNLWKGTHNYFLFLGFF